ncbi:MAG: insulinase family protein [Fimbriimonadaceae bacterium]
MLAALCSFVVLAQGPESIAKDLPNGAKLRVELDAGSKQVMVALFASSANLPGDAGTPGTRHLLEHLIAKGPDRLLDLKLESVGLSLTATTERDGTNFVIMGPSDKAVMAVESLRELLAPVVVGEEEIVNEIKIIDQEGVFRDRYSRFLDSAWLNLFDPGIESVYGNLTAMGQLKPEDLKTSGEALMSSGGLSVFVKGDVDPGVTALRVEQILATAHKGGAQVVSRTILEAIGKKETVKAKGSARAVVAAGLDRPMTLARIGSAIALMKLEPGFEVVYEPSFDHGPILFYGTSEEKFTAIKKYSRDDMRTFAPFARLQAILYVKGLQKQGPGYGVLRAKLIRQAPAFNMDQLESTAAGLTDEEIWSAVQDWQGGAMYIGGSQ